MTWLKQNWFKITGVVLFIVGLYIFWGSDETWLGFYYPDGCLNCTDQYIFSPEFDNRASCFSWATNLRQKRNNPNDTFECGKNCKTPDGPDGFYVCEETVDY